MNSSSYEKATEIIRECITLGLIRISIIQDKRKDGQSKVTFDDKIGEIEIISQCSFIKEFSKITEFLYVGF